MSIVSAVWPQCNHLYWVVLTQVSKHICGLSTGKRTIVYMCTAVKVFDQNSVGNPTGGGWELPTLKYIYLSMVMNTLFTAFDLVMIITLSMGHVLLILGYKSGSWHWEFTIHCYTLYTYNLLVSISRFPNSSTSSIFNSCLFNLSLCTLYTSISTSSISHFVNLTLQICHFFNSHFIHCHSANSEFWQVGVDKMRSLHMGNRDDPSHAYKCKPHEVYYATTSDENFTGHR